MHNPNNKECEAACDSECNQAHTHFDENDCTCPPEQKEEWENKYTCPNTGCDNNGTIAVQVGEEEFEAQQCQYCYEIWFPLRDAIRTQIALAEERGRKEMKEKVRKAMNMVYESRKNELEKVGYHDKSRAFVVAGIDLIYNANGEVLEALKRIDTL